MKEVNERMHDYREHLKTITNGLVEMAQAAGRIKYTRNGLLRECYSLVDVDTDTAYGWEQRGFEIIKGQHAYLFWDNDPDSIEEDGFSNVLFLFSKEQVKPVKKETL